MRLFLWMMLVLAWQLFSGNSGVMSFGHVAFMAAGAYFSALLTMSPTLKEINFADMPEFLASWIQPAELGLFESMLAAGALAAVLAAIFGIAVARLAGIAAAIATLAILVIMFTFIVQTPSVTGGSDVLVGVPRETTPGNVAIALVVVIFAVYAFKQSRHGMRLRASRENQEAAQSVAVNVRLERYIAFVIAGLICGVAGALYAHYFSGFAAADFYFELTFIVVAMLVVGGMQSVAGAVVGTYFLTIVYLTARRGEVDGVFGIEPPSGTANLLVAIALLLVLILRPNGITGGREVPWPGACATEGTCCGLCCRHRPGGSEGGDRGRPFGPGRRHAVAPRRHHPDERRVLVNGHDRGGVFWISSDADRRRGGGSIATTRRRSVAQWAFA